MNTDKKPKGSTSPFDNEIQITATSPQVKTTENLFQATSDFLENCLQQKESQVESSVDHEAIKAVLNASN